MGGLRYHRPDRPLRGAAPLPQIWAGDDARPATMSGGLFPNDYPSHRMSGRSPVGARRVDRGGGLLLAAARRGPASATAGSRPPGNPDSGAFR